MVQDEDGFDIPMAINDVVVIGEEDYTKPHLSTAKPVANAPSPKKAKENDDDEVDYSKVTFRAPVEERKGGNALSAYLAFVPIDIKEITHTRFECFFVNDSNYFIQYTYLAAEGNSWVLRSRGEVEPNTKEFIEEFGREDLNDLEHCCIQLMAYKRDKHYLLKSPVNAQVRVDTVKFYKLHAFRENDFFEQPALIYTLIENDVQKVKL